MAPRASARPDPLGLLLGAALAAVDARTLTRRALSERSGELRLGGTVLRASEVERLFVVGAGKAAAEMARGAQDALGGRIHGGTVTTKDGYACALPGIEVWEAGHPLPDARGLAGAAGALRLARLAGERDVVLSLLSGGASALWAAPAPGIFLGDVRAVTDALQRAGAPIEEVNTVRKHLSAIAGGRLAQLAWPARVVTLAIADVIGVGDDVIGS
ncbi:MAG TPA: glycerate-2-kinase family protein, partial [Longimicrobiaceae bacterium]|nr:glycerate-2-kinase family protein [Longimicrobiaceae bacterium]